MEQFKRILISVDAADDFRSSVPHCVTRAVRLAKETGAELRLSATAVTLPYFTRQALEATDANIAGQYERNVTSLVERVQHPDVELTWTVLQGRPFAEVIREVDRWGADLLMRDATSGDNEIFLGNIDMRLMRNCPCAVWIVHRDPASLEQVVAAIDPMPRDAAEEQFNRQILDLAASLATWESGRLHVISALETGESSIPAGFSRDVDRKQLIETSEAVRLYLQEFVKGIKPKPQKHRVRLDIGEPATIIRNYAREVDADVIVMGTMTRCDIPSLLIGNTAEQVLRTLRSSVLTMKPARFESPVLR